MNKKAEDILTKEKHSNLLATSHKRAYTKLVAENKRLAEKETDEFMQGFYKGNANALKAAAQTCNRILKEILKERGRNNVLCNKEHYTYIIYPALMRGKGAF